MRPHLSVIRSNYTKFYLTKYPAILTHTKQQKVEEAYTLVENAGLQMSLIAELQLRKAGN